MGPNFASCCSSTLLFFSLLFSSFLIPSIQAGQTEKLIKFWFQTGQTDRRNKHIVGLPSFKKQSLEFYLITDSLEVLVRLNLFQYIDLQISIKMFMWGRNSIILFPIFVMKKCVTKITTTHNRNVSTDPVIEQESMVRFRSIF